MPLNAVAVELKTSDGALLKGIGEHNTKYNTVNFSAKLMSELASKLVKAPNLWIKAVAVIDGQKFQLKSEGAEWKMQFPAEKSTINEVEWKNIMKPANEVSVIGSIKWMW